MVFYVFIFIYLFIVCCCLEATLLGKDTWMKATSATAMVFFFESYLITAMLKFLLNN